MNQFSKFRLKVQRFDRTCVFELSWGSGQQLEARLNYPESLAGLYQEWQRIYLSFYKTALRGRIKAAGTINSPPINWHAKLVEAEAAFLSEFHHWLRSAELYEIRAEIIRAASSRKEPVSTLQESDCIDVFLTCNTIELERLPWEAWEIGAELGQSRLILIARTPVNIRHEPVQPRRDRTRILVILGDDTGLNFKADREAVRSLSRLAEIVFIGWQPGKDIPELKQEICNTLASEQGWDILLFAGHSNETALTGGELTIAPDASLSISEIIPQLLTAKERGLQFALFNSCSGINIAESLINLGLSQVAVMREPIHNAVAEKFLVRFMQELGTYKDVHAAMLSACIELKVNHNLTFPSAYLILSLFRHPEAPLFRLKPWGGKQWLQSVLPCRQSAIALSTLLFISLIYPVQDVLLEQRLWVQTIYRDITGQVPVATTPPVLLVQIDQKSLQRSGISSPNPIDRSYLSKLVDKLSANNSRVVGLDYVLDLQQPGKDELLARSIRDAVKRGNWFVFAAKEGAEADVREENKIASRNWSLHGYINTHPWYVELLPANAECNSSCPFAYLLALAYGLNQQPLRPDIPRPQLQSQGDFRGQVINYLNSNSKQNSTVAFLKSRQARLHPIATFSALFDQLWLKPLIDFSIPPNQVYQRIPAWQLLENSRLYELQEKVVIIAAGGYDQAGVTTWGEDNFPVPLAIAYWRERLKSLSNEGDRTTVNPQVFTGSEAIAYTIHHLLKQRLVIPIPDLWMIAVAVLLGQGTILILQRRRLRRGWLVGVTVAYGLVSLQVYISAAVLLPVLLPSAALWVCVLGRRWQRRG